MLLDRQGVGDEEHGISRVLRAQPDATSRLRTQHTRPNRNAVARLGKAISEAVEGRQHVELDVRLAPTGGIGEAAGFDDGRGQQARLRQHILQHVADGSKALVLAEDRDRIPDLTLHGSFKMVLIILADSRQVEEHVDAVPTKMRSGTDA
jgi:hypothetical protein